VISVARVSPAQPGAPIHKHIMQKCQTLRLCFQLEHFQNVCMRIHKHQHITPDCCREAPRPVKPSYLLCTIHDTRYTIPYVLNITATPPARNQSALAAKLGN
jgi:hypothetical protein